MQLRKSLSTRRAAFTLVELMMVVVITGMMALFIFPGFSKTINKSYEKAAMNNLLLIFAAQKNYYAANGAFLGPLNTTAAINNSATGLALSIVDVNMNYSCPTAPQNAMPCKAAGINNSIVLQITVVDPPTFCCCGGSCPTVTTSCGTCY